MVGKRILIAVFAVVSATVALGSSASAYVVRPGDNLWVLSHRTGESVARLAQQNRLADPNRIYAGQQLTLDSDPGAGTGGAPPSRVMPGRTYTVRSGDTLSSIARRTGSTVADLERLNGIANPHLIRPGQQLVVAATAGTSAPAASAPAKPAPVHGEQARRIVAAAAREFGVDPAFVEAVSLWESGWNQGVVSSTGAVGLMQIEPATAAWAGPALLGGQVDSTDARQNARLGAALLNSYLGEFKDPRMALAAYYQGALGTRMYGVYPSSENYVNGIMALEAQLKAGPT